MRSAVRVPGRASMLKQAAHRQKHQHRAERECGRWIHGQGKCRLPMLHTEPCSRVAAEPEQTVRRARNACKYTEPCEADLGCTGCTLVCVLPANHKEPEHELWPQEATR